MPYDIYAEEVFGQPHEAEERRHVATFDRYEDAVAYCEDRLKKDLEEYPAEEKMIYYEHHGLDFWITGEPEGKHFSSRDFVKTLCV